MSGLVRAGGGIVRRGSAILVVHRPRYDDWTLPKGKADPGERDEDCALREVREETGFVCRLGAEIGRTEYVDGRGRPKIVRYWEMEIVDGAFEPGPEVDEIRWLEPADAVPLLTYAHDRRLVRNRLVSDTDTG